MSKYILKGGDSTKVVTDGINNNFNELYQGIQDLKDGDYARYAISTTSNSYFNFADWEGTPCALNISDGYIAFQRTGNLLHIETQFELVVNLANATKLNKDKNFCIQFKTPTVPLSAGSFGLSNFIINNGTPIQHYTQSLIYDGFIILRNNIAFLQLNDGTPVTQGMIASAILAGCANGSQVGFCFSLDVNMQ